MSPVRRDRSGGPVTRRRVRSVVPSAQRLTVALVTKHRSVRVQAVIARAPAPPGCIAPFPVEADWWPGTLLACRWADRERRMWTALVRYQGDGLMREHGVNGDLLDVGPDRRDGAWDHLTRLGIGIGRPWPPRLRRPRQRRRGMTTCACAGSERRRSRARARPWRDHRR